MFYFEQSHFHYSKRAKSFHSYMLFFAYFHLLAFSLTFPLLSLSLFSISPSPRKQASNPFGISTQNTDDKEAARRIGKQGKERATSRHSFIHSSLPRWTHTCSSLVGWLARHDRRTENEISLFSESAVVGCFGS